MLFIFLLWEVMKTEKLNEILKIVEDKVKMDLAWKSWMTIDINESFDWLIDEVEEAKEEFRDNKQVYLEDEICDIIWTILRISKLLDAQWVIDSDRIFDRVIKKYSQRVYWLQEWKKWDDIKKVQKIELLKEQTNLENNK